MAIKVNISSKEFAEDIKKRSEESKKIDNTIASISRTLEKLKNYTEKEEYLERQIFETRNRLKDEEEAFTKKQIDRYGTLFKIQEIAIKKAAEKEAMEKQRLLIKSLSDEKLVASERTRLIYYQWEDVNKKIADQQLVHWDKQQGFFKGMAQIAKGIFIDPFILASKGINAFNQFASKSRNLIEGDFKAVFEGAKTEEQKQLVIQQQIQGNLETLINMLRAERRGEAEKLAVNQIVKELNLSNIQQKDIQDLFVKEGKFDYKSFVDEWKKDNNVLVELLTEKQLNIVNAKLAPTIEAIKSSNKEKQLNIVNAKLAPTIEAIKSSNKEKDFNKEVQKQNIDISRKNSKGIEEISKASGGMLGFLSKIAGYMMQVVAVIGSLALGLLLGTVLNNILTLFWMRFLQPAFNELKEKLDQLNFMKNWFKGFDLPSIEEGKPKIKEGTSVDVIAPSLNDAFISKGGKLYPISDDDNIMAYKKPTPKILNSLLTGAPNIVSPNVNNNISIDNSELANRIDNLSAIMKEILEINKQGLLNNKAVVTGSKIIG